MVESVVHVHPGGKLVALVGNPNCGKTALFNGLTGSHQKVANYAGVTVERKEGRLISAAGKALRLLDLPGTYSLHPRSPDERVTCDVLAGRARGEKRPDLVVMVLDATNLRRNLRLLLAVRRLIYDDADKPVQWLHGFYRPDRYAYEMQLSRVGSIDAKVWVSKDVTAPFN